jgi:hypothetical protein
MNVVSVRPAPRALLGAAALAIALGALAPSAASAQGAYVGIGLGPAVRIDDFPNQFRVEQEIGIYVSGEPRGFFLSFAPSQSWGAGWWILSFPLRLGGMFDIHRGRDFTFQLGPTGTVGFAVSDQFDTPRNDADPWFQLSFGAALRFLFLRETLAFYVRPLDFVFSISDTGRYGNEAIRYVLAAGIQYYF